MILKVPLPRPLLTTIKICCTSKTKCTSDHQQLPHSFQSPHRILLTFFIVPNAFPFTSAAFQQLFIYLWLNRGATDPEGHAASLAAVSVRSGLAGIIASTNVDKVSLVIVVIVYGVCHDTIGGGLHIEQHPKDCSRCVCQRFPKISSKCGSLPAGSMSGTQLQGVRPQYKADPWNRRFYASIVGSICNDSALWAIFACAGALRTQHHDPLQLVLRR